MNSVKKSFVSKQSPKEGLKVYRQCELLSLSVASFYRESCPSGERV